MDDSQTSPAQSRTTTPESPRRTSSSTSATATAVDTASGIVSLSRSKQTWTGAGSAAGFALRYLGPLRRLMQEATGRDESADQALAILVQHLVRTGFGDQKNGLLRDVLLRGMRASAKAAAEAPTPPPKPRDRKAVVLPTPPPPPLNLQNVKTQSPVWIGYWREGLLERAWRSLERHQHAARYRDTGQSPAESSGEATQAPTNHDLVHDVLRTAMAHSGESAAVLSGRVAAVAGRPVTEEELRVQLKAARVLFAQFLADEVAQTLEPSEPGAIHAEIKALGLQKVFAGVPVRR